MGITGLLPFLKDIHRPCHIKSFAGQTLGVDGYVWLHRGVYSCASELGLGQPTTRYVAYTLAKVRMLRHWGIEPYLVFDGGPLPSKKGTEESRRRSREENRERGKRLLAEGKKEEAREALARSVDVTAEMAYQLIKALRAEKVRYVVAPFEADAQLRFLEMHGHIDGIVTEDSDLLVFGACNVVFKLDKDGACVNIRRDDFGKVPDSGMAYWTDRQFRQMAILSGCDYLPSISGIGLKKANELIRRCKTVEKAISNLALNHKNFSIPRGYLKAFRSAELTFLHQLVYDPATSRLVPLHPLPDPPPPPEDLAGCGESFSDEIASGVAEGRLHPATHEPIKDLHVAGVSGFGAAAAANITLSANAKASETASWYKKVSGKKPVQISKNQTTLGTFFQRRTPSQPFSLEPAGRGGKPVPPKSPSGRDVFGDVRNVPSPPRKSTSPRTASKFFSKATPIAGSNTKPSDRANADGFAAKALTSTASISLGSIELKMKETAMEAKQAVRNTSEDRLWEDLDLENIDRPIEDAEPLDDAGWIKASQEEEEREAAAREEEDWKSDVLSIAAAADEAEDRGEVFLREDWEDGMADWDTDLPSSQMQGDRTMTPALDAAEVEGDEGDEWRSENGEHGGIVDEDDTMEQSRIGSEMFSEALTSPVTSPEQVRRVVKGVDLPSPVASPSHGSLDKHARDGFDGSPSIDEDLDRPAKRSRTWQSSGSSVAVSVAPARVAVLAPPLQAATPASSSKEALLVSDPILESEDVDTPVEAPIFASGSTRKRSFKPSPKKRRSSAGKTRKKALSSADDAEDEEASPALAKFKQDLRARFMHRGSGVAPPTATPKSALGAGRRMTLGPGKVASDPQADLSDIIASVRRKASSSKSRSAGPKDGLLGDDAAEMEDDEVLDEAEEAIEKCLSPPKQKKAATFLGRTPLSRQPANSRTAKSSSSSRIDCPRASQRFSGLCGSSTDVEQPSAPSQVTHSKLQSFRFVSGSGV